MAEEVIAPIVNETVVDEAVVESPTVDEVVTGEPETVVEGTDEIVEETKEDLPIEDLFGEEDLVDESLYHIDGYDLTKYKEMGLDLESEDSKEFVEYIGKFKEQGFSQEQVDFIIADRLEDNKEVVEPKEITREQIKENLNKNLSLEEKRNYKSINKFVTASLKGSGLEQYQNEIVTNPVLVKLFNAVYKNSLGKTTNINRVSKPKQASEQIVNESNARDLFFNEVEGIKGRLTPEIKSEIINKLIKQSGNNVKVKESLEKYL